MAVTVGAFLYMMRLLFSAHARATTLSLICVAYEMLYDTALKSAFKLLIDSILPDEDGVGGDKRQLSMLIVGLSVGLVFSILAGTKRSTWYAQATAKASSNLRTQLISKTHSLPMAYFATNPKSLTMSHFTTDIQTIETAMTIPLLTLLRALFAILFTMVVLFFLNPLYAAFTVLTFPIIFAAPQMLTKSAVKGSGEHKLALDDLESQIEEQVEGMEVIRSFHLGKYCEKKLLGNLNAVEKSDQKVGRVNYLVLISPNMAVQAIELIILAAGSYLVFADAITLGTFVSFFVLFTSAAFALVDIAWSMPYFIEAATTSKRLKDYLELDFDSLKDGTRELATLNKGISFDSVYFGFGREHTLKNISAHIRCGEHVAVVGPSGSGKTTLLKLLMRFYDVNRGHILFDSVDQRDLTSVSRKQLISFVGQNSFLFDMTIRANIAISFPDATHADMVYAAKRAEIHDTIVNLPMGYDTKVGSAGGLLSGGQRQRICIARALMGNPQILILDECTSALDGKSANAIEDTLQALRSTCTIIAVTHHLDSCAKYDRVLVLKDGELVQQGKHRDLLQIAGVYSSMYYSAGLTDMESSTILPAVIDSKEKRRRKRNKTRKKFDLRPRSSVTYNDTEARHFAEAATKSEPKHARSATVGAAGPIRNKQPLQPPASLNGGVRILVKDDHGVLLEQGYFKQLIQRGGIYWSILRETSDHLSNYTIEVKDRHGRTVEEGVHQDLMASNGLYKIVVENGSAALVDDKDDYTVRSEPTLRKMSLEPPKYQEAPKYESYDSSSSEEGVLIEYVDKPSVHDVSMEWDGGDLSV